MAAGAASSAAEGHVPLPGEGETLTELTPEAAAAAWAGVRDDAAPPAVDGPAAASAPEEAAEEDPSTSAEAAQLSAVFSEADVESLAAVLGISTGAAQKKLECMDVSSHAEYSGQILQLAVAQHYSGLAAKKR
jgi:hypothetical protein